MGKYYDYVSFADIQQKIKQIYRIAKQLPHKHKEVNPAIVNAVSRLQGISVIPAVRDLKNLDGICVKDSLGTVHVVVNSERPFPAQRFSMVKELGHVIFNPKFKSEVRVPESLLLKLILKWGMESAHTFEPCETIAQTFALELFMPSYDHRVRKMLKDFKGDPSKLGELFGVPPEAVIMRLSYKYPFMGNKRS